MVLKATAPVSSLMKLKGYPELGYDERVLFAQYVLFQLAFSLQSLARIGCQHRDLASLHIGHNIRYREVEGLTDPCQNQKKCPWGRCWSAGGSLWCFERSQTPLLDVITQVFDFGNSLCQNPNSPLLSWYVTHRVKACCRVEKKCRTAYFLLLRASSRRYEGYGPGMAAVVHGWARKPGKVTDDTFLSRACRHLKLGDCPSAFSAPIAALSSPYFQQFRFEGTVLPRGACVIGLDSDRFNTMPGASVQQGVATKPSESPPPVKSWWQMWRR
jgi:hypothetical protein